MNNPEVTKYVKFLFGFALIGIIFILGFFSGRFSLNYLGADSFSFSNTSNEGSPIDASILDEVWYQIEQNHLNYDEIDRDKIVYGAAKGIIDALEDDYSQFLTPEETGTYSESSGSKFEGIGAVLRTDGDYTLIDTPIDGFPAQKAGLMPGDVILKVNDNDVAGKSTSEVAELIKGPAGSSVKIDIIRPKDQKEMTFNITRESIDIDNIELKSVENGIAHIKITKFNESSSEEFVRQWDAIVEQVEKKDADSIVLDLRNNPGGLVSLVQYVSEEFLDRGDIVMIEEENNGERREFKSTRDGRFRNKKVIILVNEGSASASEIMAGALIDNDRAEVVGKKTVGKGVEQKLINLSDGSTMHLVFRRWLTPNGKQVTKEDPINPDYEVDLSTEDFQAKRDPQLDKALELLK